MSRNKAFLRPNLPLTAPVFYILLTLAVKQRHGYEIMKRVNEESFGKIQLGPGTLYSAIKRMLEAGLIAQTGLVTGDGQERRKYYKLTEKGRKVLGVELQRFSQALQVAKKNKLMSNLAFSYA